MRRAACVGACVVAGALAACAPPSVQDPAWRASGAAPTAAAARPVTAIPRPVTVVAQRISIPTAGRSTAPGPLTGFLYRPRGSAPHPAVVMLHGCGGAFDRRGAVNARYAMWGEYLASLGYEALLVDSFGARGLTQICTTPMGARMLKESDRVGDAYAALAWLQAQPDVEPARIAQLGWSHGGGVTLNAIGRARPAHAFATAVAFYPGCTARSAHPERFHPYAPLLVLMGEADDWTPAAPCHSLARAVSARGEPMTLVTYPGTYHDFDNPALRSVRVRREVPNGVHPGAGVTSAPNAAAREDAKRRVAACLAQAMR